MRQFLLALCLFAAGCSNVTPANFKGTTPELKLEEYFAGPGVAHGMVQDRSGKIIKSFVVDLNGVWDAATQTLTLQEDFVYNDGTTEQRIWKLTKSDGNKWQGAAHGVVGLAKGEAAGNAFYMNYVFDLPYKNSTVRVKFDDWMFLQPDGVLINRAVMSKWGYKLADITISFQKGGQGGGVKTAAPNQ